MDRGDSADLPRLRTTSDALKDTAVAASLAAEIPPGKNVLCAGTFGLAWQALEEVSGGPVEVDQVPGFSRDVRETACRRDDIDDASYLARAVMGPEGLAALKQELEKKLKGAGAPQLLPQSLAEGTLLVFASLFKNLRLQTPLARDEDGFLPFSGKPVVSFGVWDVKDTALWEDRAAQVIVHDHADDNDFVIELSTMAKEDRLILARVPPQKTLIETAKAALARTNSNPGFFQRVFGGRKLKRGEELRIPVLDFEIEHRFDEIENRTILPLGRPLSMAAQMVRLRLDEYGALLKSEVALELPKSRSAKLRSFLFDGPFLVMMIRQGASFPYLALWVATPELLINAA